MTTHPQGYEVAPKKKKNTTFYCCKRIVKQLNRTIAILVLLTSAQFGFAQKHSRSDHKNQLRIEIIDVVDRESLDDLICIIGSQTDTTRILMQDTNVLLLELEHAGAYFCQVYKDGYDTLHLDFENPTDSAELLIEFFLPGTDLTKPEKKKAHKHSLQLTDRPDEKNGGFERIRASRREYCVLRYRAFMEENTSKLYIFHKF